MLSSLIFFLSIRYSLVVDAGSTATRINAYYWDETISSADVRLYQNPSNNLPNSVNIPLSNAVHDSTAIDRIINPLLNWAKQQIPSDAQSQTAIGVYGTSSMRQLPRDERLTIMSTVEDMLKQDGTFVVEDYACRVLSSEEEASFLWVALSTQLGYIDSNDVKVSAIEIASQNAAYSVNVDSTSGIREWSNSITFPTISYTLFVPVFEGAGIDEVILNHTVSLAIQNQRSEISSPCFLKGYTGNIQNFVVTGDGDFDRCYEDISKYTLIKQDCGSSNCMFNGVPRVSFDMLYGFSTIFYTRDFFNLSETAKISEYVSKGREYCASEFSEVQSENPDNEFVDRYCIYVSFITNFLQRGLGVDDNTNFHATDSINGEPVTYSLGIVLGQQRELEYNMDPLEWYEILVVVLFFAAILAVIIILIVCCCVSQKKKKAKENEILLLEYQWHESDSGFELESEDEQKRIEYLRKSPDQKVADNINKAVTIMGKTKLEIKTREDEVTSAMQEMAAFIAPENVLNGNIHQVKSNEQKVEENLQNAYNQMNTIQLKTPNLSENEASEAIKDLHDKIGNVNLEIDQHSPESLPAIMQDMKDKATPKLKINMDKQDPNQKS